MKQCSKCKQVKAPDCFNTDRKSSTGLQSRCKACNKEQTRVWKAENVARVRLKKKEWSQNNVDKVRTHWKKWKENNPQSYTEDRLKRFKRYVKWLTAEDKIKIKSKYALARKKTRTTGEQWEVDHIIPLNGALVSGLHVPSNLRVIKRTTNLKKGNKFVVA